MLSRIGVDLVAEAISITYSEYVFVAWVIQHAKRMRRIMLSHVACPVLRYFSTLSHKRHDFQEKIFLSLNFLPRFSVLLLSETFFVLRRI